MDIFSPTYTMCNMFEAQCDHNMLGVETSNVEYRLLVTQSL